MKHKLRENRKGNNKSCLSSLQWAYKRQAKVRNLAWELTKEQFTEFTKQNCWYCGQEPAQIRRRYNKTLKDAYYLYSGIDRIDNAVGYTEANCIPCCGKCNKMKSILSAEDFIEHIRKIAHNLG